MVGEQAREVAKALFRRKVAEDHTFEGLVELYVEAIDELHRLKNHTPYGTKVWEDDEDE
jgi:hypothetical protein